MQWYLTSLVPVFPASKLKYVRYFFSHEHDMIKKKEFLEQKDNIVRPTIQSMLGMYATVGREIFTLKIIRVKNFRVIKFSLFHSIRETVDNCELLESSWH